MLSLQCRRFLFFPIAVAGILQMSNQSPAALPDSRLIDANSAVGSGIRKNTTERDLIQRYGQKNVKRSPIAVGEGETVAGTLLFPGTKDEVAIEWKKAYAQPARVTIAKAGTSWRTKEGISIGTSLEKVEQANQGAFKLTGFGWDYPGRTVSWEGGKLSSSLQLDFVPTKKVTAREEQSVLGSGEFSSRQPVMQKMKLKVARLYVRW